MDTRAERIRSEQSRRLIRKAVIARCSEVNGATRNERTEGARRLDVFEEVAADVLRLCHTPFVFRMAVIETLRSGKPMPGSFSIQGTRAAWIEAQVDAVVNRLVEGA